MSHYALDRRFSVPLEIRNIVRRSEDPSDRRIFSVQAQVRFNILRLPRPSVGNRFASRRQRYVYYTLVRKDRPLQTRSNSFTLPSPANRPKPEQKESHTHPGWRQKGRLRRTKIDLPCKIRVIGSECQGDLEINSHEGTENEQQDLDQKSRHRLRPRRCRHSQPGSSSQAQ